MPRIPRMSFLHVRRAGVVVPALVLCVALSLPAPVGASNEPRSTRAAALEVADFILDLQTASGAIPDAPGSVRVNEDSNMEYALIGLASAYAETGDPRYLSGLEDGIAWLAAREEMSDPQWRGSWHYVYSSQPPFEPLRTSPGGDVEDVRGVDATSSLFAYLVHLHGRVTGTTDLATTYEPEVRAALDFVLARNRADDGFFHSSWQLRDGSWRLWRFQYAADQGDVYLGMQAGALMYGDPDYQGSADFLEAEVSGAFFERRRERYALGRDRNGRRDPAMEGFNAIFPQGYLPWVFGDSPKARAALEWLRVHRLRDGSITVRRGRDYSLSPAVFAMGRAGVGSSPPSRSLRWLETVPLKGGCIHDFGDGGPCYANVAGLSVVALLGFLPFE